MPRKARIDAPGSVHHIIVRGIDRMPVFKDPLDYRDFLDRLGRLLGEASASCCAWVLMRNHFHLLMRTGSTPLASLMGRLLTGYARQFNRRHNRCGHLFQNRYKSFLCEEEPYFLELVRYIHLNPFRAGIVKDMKTLDGFPWCGHSVLMGEVERLWQDTGSVLSRFHDDRKIALRAYRLFVEGGIAMGKRPDLVGGGLIRSSGGWKFLGGQRNSVEHFASDERILGSSEFVTSVLKRAGEDYERRTRAAISGLDIEGIISIVCERCGLDRSLLPGREKKVPIVRARALVCHVSFNMYGLKGVDIAKALNMTSSGVSRLAQRGRNDPLSVEIEGMLSEMIED